MSEPNCELPGLVKVQTVQGVAYFWAWDVCCVQDSPDKRHCTILINRGVAATQIVAVGKAEDVAKDLHRAYTTFVAEQFLRDLTRRGVQEVIGGLAALVGTDDAKVRPMVEAAVMDMVPSKVRAELLRMGDDEAPKAKAAGSRGKG